jgi:hypothetical protein
VQSWHASRAHSRTTPRYNWCGASMTLGRIGRELAVVAVLCVLTVFLFPSLQGPYTAVHGPATALQASRAAARLRIVIAQAALICPQSSVVDTSRSVISPPVLASPELETACVAGLDNVLRC